MVQSCADRILASDLAGMACQCHPKDPPDSADEAAEEFLSVRSAGSTHASPLTAGSFRAPHLTAMLPIFHDLVKQPGLCAPSA